MAGGVFINYRREDAAGFAHALFPRLTAKFKGRVFMDVERMQAGSNFIEVLSEEVEKCDVLLAIIGPAWLTVCNGRGERRLDDPDDFVRIEIVAAIAAGKRVIPVLVNGAGIPSAAALPDILQPLPHLHAVRLTNERFTSDCDGLVKQVEVILTGADGARTAAAREDEQRRVAALAEQALRRKEEEATARAAEQVQRNMEADAARQRAEEDWKEAIFVGTSASIAAYLEKWPNGSRVGDAVVHLDELAWKEARRSNTAASYEQYCKTDGKHADEALQRWRQFDPTAAEAWRRRRPSLLESISQMGRREYGTLVPEAERNSYSPPLPEAPPTRKF